MNSQQLYRHKNMRDAAIEILKSETVGSNLEIKVLWWNIGGCHTPFPMAKDRLKVPLDKVTDWLPFGFTDYGPGPRTAKDLPYSRRVEV